MELFYYIASFLWSYFTKESFYYRATLLRSVFTMELFNIHSMHLSKIRNDLISSKQIQILRLQIQNSNIPHKVCLFPMDVSLFSLRRIQMSGLAIRVLKLGITCFGSAGPGFLKVPPTTITTPKQ